MIGLTDHFTIEEMECRCHRPECDSLPMDDNFMEMMEQLYKGWGGKLVVTSGTRCSFWNKAQGGASDSQHLLGRACDLFMNSYDEILELAEIAEDLGFGGLGIGKFHLLHVDAGPSGRRWSYPDK